MNARVHIKDIKDIQKFYIWMRKLSNQVTVRRKIKIFAIKEPVCYICGSKLTFIDFYVRNNKIQIAAFITEKGTLLTLDHFLPARIGKINTINNLEPCCEPCNQYKGDTIPLLPQVNIVNEVVCNNSIDLLHTTNSTFLFNKLVNQLK